MPNASGSVWTEALVADLIRLWDRGYSCAQIGAVIGVTRNAVIGKAARLKLPTHTRARNVNGQKRAVDPIPAETPRTSPRNRRPQTVFKSRERKPKARIINPNAKPAIMVAVSIITGLQTGAARIRRPGMGNLTKDEMRAMLSDAMRNTAAMGVS